MGRAAKLLGASLVVSMLAIVAGIGTARSQTPPPTPAPLPWDEAELSWPAPTTFAITGDTGGGSLADCATGPCMVRYIVEANAPGGNGWGPIAVTDVTTYKVTRLWAGTWQFRVKAFWGLTGYSPPSPVATKVIVEPLAKEPVVSPPAAMNAK